MKVNVSIVTYNHSEEFLRPVLESVFKNHEVVANLFIVDNSADTRLQDLETKYPLKYISAGGNRGYGAGHNIAIQKTLSSDVAFHLVLNPDITFPENTLVRLLDYLQHHPNVSLLMPKILYPNGTLQEVARPLPSALELFGRRFLPKAVMKKIALMPQFPTLTSPTFFPGLSGCFMLIRSEPLKRIGGFDERYFMYMEDMDLSRRLAEVGEAVYLPEISVTHEFQKDSYKNRKLLKYHITSAIKYYNKWGWVFDSHRRRLNQKFFAQNLFPSLTKK